MCTLNDILFPVEKVQVTEFDCNSDYAFDIFAYPDDEKLRVNSCSDRYELVPNADIFPNVRQVLLDNNIEFTENYQMIDNARFYAQYNITDDRFKYTMKNSNGDVIQPMLKVQHSYNGLTKYKINFGYFRLVCSNGLVLPVHEMQEYNLSIEGRHTKAIKASFEKLDEKLKYFVENAAQITTAITAKYDELSGNVIKNVQDRLTEVLNVINLKPRELKSGEISFPAMDIALSALTRESDLYDGEVNDWLIYNAVNQYIYKPDTLATPEAKADKDSKVLEYLLQSV